MSWLSPNNPPLHGERVIILVKHGTREQFATWNNQSKVFTNAGGTQFKPEQIKLWLPLSALPKVEGTLTENDYL